MSRKLVTIRTVSDINPIDGADNIECLTVDGWKVVSQKGNFQIGDPCVYFEIDSFLPDGNPLWQDLVDKSQREFEGKKGHVLRTVKLRGVPSQGFCIPLYKFPEICDKLGLKITWTSEAEYDLKTVHRLDIKDELAEHFQHYVTSAFRDVVDKVVLRETDWAEVLGILKYEGPIHGSIAGFVKGNFPSIIKKTDQERAQNMISEIFADLDVRYEISVKLDGSSMTVFHSEDGGGVCSRNLELKTDESNRDNSLVKVSTETKLTDFLAENPTLAFQGELMGPSIQGNRETLSKPTYFIYDIYLISEGRYLSPAERTEIFNMYAHQVGKNAASHVPVLHASVSLRELGLTNIEELLAFAEGPSLKHQVREGLVFKRIDGASSFKVVSNKFLIKSKD